MKRLLFYFISFIVIGCDNNNDISEIPFISHESLIFKKSNNSIVQDSLILTIIFTDGIGQNLFGQIIPWNKWPLTIHSAAWGLIFNIIGATVISFITQELKETKIKKRIHEFIDEHKNYSLTKRSLKPSAWIILIVWIFFAFGPGLMIGNELFGKPINVESWSFGMPSIWVWQAIFWAIGILLVWFLAVKMEMSTSLEKNIVSQTEDINNT